MNRKPWNVIVTEYTKDTEDESVKDVNSLLYTYLVGTHSECQYYTYLLWDYILPNFTA